MPLNVAKYVERYGVAVCGSGFGTAVIDSESSQTTGLSYHDSGEKVSCYDY